MASNLSPAGIFNSTGLCTLLFGAAEGSNITDSSNEGAEVANNGQDGTVENANFVEADSRMQSPTEATITSDKPEEMEKNCPERSKAAAGSYDSSGEESESEINDPPAKKLMNMDTARPAAFDAGYDSDGERGPDNRTEVEEGLIEEEEALGDSPIEVQEVKENNDDEEEVEEEVKPPPPNVPVSIPEETLTSSKFLVKDIKEELKIRNVTFPSRFGKTELLERLRASLHLPVVARRCDTTQKKGKSKEKKPRTDDMSEFAPGAYWKVLTPSEEPVKEPENSTFEAARAPTVPADDALKPTVVKHNFGEKFERPKFTGTKKIHKKDAEGNVMRDDDGNIIYESVPRTRGNPKQTFLDMHGLDQDSHPVEFLEAFLPVKLNKFKDKHNEPYLSLSTCQQWTNMKALLANAGTEDCYKDFKPFTVKEIQQHVALLMLNGLRIST